MRAHDTLREARVYFARALQSVPAASVRRTLVLLSILVAGAGCLAAQTVLVGGQTIESNLDSNAAGVAEAFPVTAISSGQVTSINFFLDESSASTKVVVGLYTESGGNPGTLLTQGNTSQLFPGTWNSVSVTATTLTSGTTYWIAILGASGGKPYFHDRSTTACHSQTSSQSTLTLLPGTWSKGTSWNTCYISAYAVAGTLPATVMIGNQAVETNLDKNPAKQAEAFPALANTTGSVATINLYLDPTSGTGPVSVGLYADNGHNHPGTLLGQGSTSSPVAGIWNPISIAASSINAGTRYWIAVLGTQATSPYFRDRQTTACHSETSSQTSLTSLPSTWSTGSTFNTCYISAYGVGGSGSPILSISPSTIAFNAIQGGANPVPASLSVTNTGSGALPFTDSSDQPWLSASPTSGTAPQNLQVSATTGSLTAGTYTGHVTVTGAGAQGSPAIATVTFTISPFVPPSISAAVSPAPNANGWNNSIVTVTFTCAPGSYAILSCTAPVQVNTQGANQIVTGTAVDTAGDQTSTSVTLNISSAPPTITASVSPAPNSAGWEDTPPTVSYTCTPAAAPITSCPLPQTVNTSGANQKVTGTVTDAAGNTAAVTTSLNIELQGPVVAATATPGPNATGWNKTPVTVSFTCTPGIAPLASCPAPQTVTTQAADQLISGTVTDTAGNSALGSATVSLDQTAPMITASLLPPANANGWNNGPVTVTFTCTDALSGIVACPLPVETATSGAGQVITGQVSDLAGNTASTSVTINLSTTPPQITAVVSPAPNANGWANANTTVTFVCTQGGAPIAICPNAQTFSGEGAFQQIKGTVTDLAGASASATATFSIDKTPPALNVTSPLNVTNVSSSQLTIQGLTSDALSGVRAVTCNGTAANLTGTAFSCGITLSLGGNTITVVATDGAGNSTTSTLNISFVTPVNVQITSPTSLQLFSGNPVTVTGTVGDSTSTVTVNGVTATQSGGMFTAQNVVLREGMNLLTASATSPGGGVGSDTLTVYLDTAPPTVVIDNPANGAVVTSSQIDVTGNVNDIVRGTVNGDQVSVTVNGVTATVANRTFAAHGVLLVPGSNTITAVATDRAGNQSQNQVQVALQQLAGQTLSIISGNAQSGQIRTTLTQALAVLATDALGRAMPNVPLNFSVLKSDGLLISGQQQGRELTIKTSVSGQASVQFQLGSRNGAGANQVSVSSVGFVGQAVFSEDTTVGTASQINTVEGEIQVGAVGTALAEPLTAIVFDAGGNPVAGVPVTYTVTAGGGLISGQSTFTQNTDSDGKAYAVLVLGQQEGINNNTVQASFAGLKGQPASFVSSGVIRGPVAATVVSGLVLDDAEQPIVNATASIQGTNLSARTNSQGQFTIASAPVGDIVLYVDGGTSTSSYTFPTLSFQMATIPGINNTLGHPVYLPAIDTHNSQVVGGNQAVQLTMTGVPGLVYTVAPNSVTFPDGSHVGTLTLSQVHGDRVPMTPPNGTAPRLVGTLQPAGVLFNPPIQIQLPNTDGLPPGQVEEIFSFHHDLEQFVVEGTARVSEDGSVVVSDPGFGLSVSGWHGGGGNPQPPTCGDGCTGCGSCQNGACVQNSSLDGFTVFALDQNQQQQTDLAEVVDQTITAVTVPFMSQATSNMGNTGPLTYTWDFGDGNTGSGPDFPTSHDYAPGGPYTAMFTATCSNCPNQPQLNTSVTIAIGQVKIQEVDFQQSSTLSSDPVGTSGSSSPIQASWIAAASGGSDQQNSVSYVRNSTISLNATFAINPPLQTPVTNVTIEGDGPDGITFLLQNQTLSGSSAMFPLTADSQLADMIQLYSPFAITWTITPGTGTALAAGTSKNKMYVTWSPPVSPSNFESVVNIATQGAQGLSGTDDSAVASGIWNVFKSLNVQTVNGVQMTYWKTDASSTSFCNTVPGLIALNDGACTSWAQLLAYTWLAEGLTGSQVLEVLPDTNVNPGAIGFMINGWSFGKHIRTGPNGIRKSQNSSDDIALFPVNTAYPNGVCIEPGSSGILKTTHLIGDDRFNTVNGTASIVSGPNGTCDTTAATGDTQVVAVGSPASPNFPVIGPGVNGILESTPIAPDVIHMGIFDGSTYPFLWFDPTEAVSNIGEIGDTTAQDRVPAQGNTDSPSFFYNHYVTLYKNQLYDPSYGTGPYAVTSTGTQTYTSIAHEVASIAGIASCGQDGKTPTGTACLGIGNSVNNISTPGFANQKSARSQTPELKYVVVPGLSF